MEAQKWEYKVAYVEGWQRVSVEGQETHPEEGERNSAFGRRFLNQMGSDSWELSDIQVTGPGQAYYVFKRPLAAGAEPDLSVTRRSESQPESQAPSQPESQGMPQPTVRGEVVSV